jgi:hybrid cluster-associated redox disulfide protein
MKKKPKITKEMTIGEVIRNYPETLPLFLNYGLHCVSCPVAQAETIEQAAKVHRIDLDKFLQELNKTIEK